MTTFVLENTTLKLSVKFYGVKVRSYGCKSLIYVCAFYHPLEGDESFMSNFFSSVNRGVHAHTCIMSNHSNLAGNSKICIGIQIQLIFLNSYIRHVFFEKSNLRIQRNNTLNLECKEVRDQFLENLNFSIHFL